MTSRCCQLPASTGDWLAGLRTCIAEGGTLAKPESAAENTAVQGLLGEPRVTILSRVTCPRHAGGQVGWVGLQDFLNEGSFTWADGASLGSYTNWANNQPDNNGQGQVRVRPRVT